MIVGVIRSPTTQQIQMITTDLAFKIQRYKKANVSVQDLTPSGKTTVETADAAGDQNGAKVTLAPRQTTILNWSRSSGRTGNYSKLLLSPDPCCPQVGDIKKEIYFQMINIFILFKMMDGG